MKLSEFPINTPGNSDFVVGVSAANVDYRFPVPSLGSSRKLLIADTNFNVSTAGNDVTGDGSAGAPWATIQHAINVVSMQYDLQGFNVTIQVADGTYQGALIGDFFNFVPNPANGVNFVPVPMVKIQGNASDHTKVKITGAAAFNSTCFFVDVDLSSAMVCIKNMKLDNPFAAGSVIVMGPTLLLIGDGDGVGTIEIDPGVIGGGDSFIAQFGGTISLNDNIIYSNSSTYGISCEFESFVTDFFSTVQTTITFSGSSGLTFFARTQVGGTIWLSGVTFSGSFTGSRFFAQGGGVIDLSRIGGSSLTTIPGSTPGIVSGSGQYVYSNGIFAIHSYGGVIVSALPAASIGIGATNFVTDSTASLSAGLGNVVAGLGGNSVPVYSDGTNWRIG